MSQAPMNPVPMPEHRAAATARIAAATGIDEAMIEALVARFYAKVRGDAVLGPVFAAKITDWGPHLKRMCEFWSSVALLTGRYHGQPMPKHLSLPIDEAHFARWLGLFQETLDETCPPAARVHFMDRARRIAESFRLGIAMQRGTLIAELDAKGSMQKEQAP
jgi:hemoglobin